MIKVAIGLCTCNRPDGLRAALESILAQKFPHPEAYAVRIIVSDNAPNPQTETIVAELSGKSPYPIMLINEPKRGISEARNRVVEEALNDDALLFMDDDEIAEPDWADRLLACWKAHHADILLGPVEFVFESKPIREWMRHAVVFKKMSYPTGTRFTWGYTSNILISRKVLTEITHFDPLFSFTGGGDGDFTTRAVKAGFSIIWCEEAVVKETVPSERVTTKWIFMRSLRLGANAPVIERRQGGNPYSGLPRYVIAAFYYAGALMLSVMTGNPERIGLYFCKLAQRLGYVIGTFNFRYYEYRKLP